MIPGSGQGTGVSEKKKRAEEPIGFEGQAIGFGDEVIVGDRSWGGGAET